MSWFRLLGLFSLMLLVGCGSAAPANQAAAPLVTAAATATDSSPSGAVPVTQGQPLRIAENQFPTSLDGDVGFAGHALMSYGIAEALMKITPDMQLKPWLAEAVTPLDPLTWRVTLRPKITFWDGSPVDAAAVKAAFERSMSKQANAVKALLPLSTTLTINGAALEIRTPQPVPALPNYLASYYLTIKKVAADGSLIYTGPYQPRDYVEKASVTLEAYAGYHGGPPRTATINVRFIPDVNTRLLALQAGDVDLAHGLLPAHRSLLENAGFKVVTSPSARQNDLLLNVQRPPLDEVAVRQALALGVDRAELVSGVLDGVGTPAYALAPQNVGLAGLLDTQRDDRAAAEQLLDGAGWKRGADGIRVKGTQRLAFKLGFYQQRAELEPLAVAIKAQWQTLGVEVTLDQIADINSAVAESTFDATLYAYGMAPYGDLNHALASLYTPSDRNRERYNNPELTTLLARYNTTAERAERLTLLSSMQTVLGQDVPVIYINNPAQIAAMTSAVDGFTAHPLENYKLDGLISRR